MFDGFRLLNSCFFCFLFNSFSGKDTDPQDTVDKKKKKKIIFKGRALCNYNKIY